MEGEISVLQVEKKIRSRVKRQMEKTQREYYLNEQMKAIQRELGEQDDQRDELMELEKRIKKTKLSKEARTKADGELKKLRNMSPMSAESTVVRNYLDWLLSIPWGKAKTKSVDMLEAERILDEDHYGLEKVKERILEYLAVQSRTGNLKGPILCLVGPPGVGKTSLGKLDRQGYGARVRAPVARRRARRGRDQGPPAHLHRLHARQDHPVDEEGEVHQPLLPAGRDRQAGRRLARRPVVGAAGGAGSRAELHLRRPLPGGGLRPQPGDVRHHGQQPEHARAADWTGWRSSASPATPRTRSWRSPSATSCPSSPSRPRVEAPRSGSCPTTLCAT